MNFIAVFVFALASGVTPTILVARDDPDRPAASSSSRPASGCCSRRCTCASATCSRSGRCSSRSGSTALADHVSRHRLRQPQAPCRLRAHRDDQPGGHAAGADGPRVHRSERLSDRRRRGARGVAGDPRPRDHPGASSRSVGGCSRARRRGWRRTCSGVTAPPGSAGARRAARPGPPSRARPAPGSRRGSCACTSPGRSGANSGSAERPAVADVVERVEQVEHRGLLAPCRC